MTDPKEKEKTGRKTRTIGGEEVKPRVETTEETSPPQVQCRNKSYQIVLTITFIDLHFQVGEMQNLRQEDRMFQTGYVFLGMGSAKNVIFMGPRQDLPYRWP